jgi:molybdopterin synthase catalytic subunit
MIRLTEQGFDPGAELTGFCAGRSESGAVASFVGIARGEGGAATALELQAYPGFTEAEIGRMVEAAMARFSLHDALVIHRHGRIAPGEPIVMVATASAHRRAAFEACDYLMDYLKSRAPFWKKEHGPDGARWVEPTARDLDDLARWGWTGDSNRESFIR